MPFLLRNRNSRPVYPVASGTLWSDPATWGGSVPEAGDTVTIGLGMAVTLDTDTEDIAELILNGDLVVSTSVDTSLTAGRITGGSTGRYLSGTEASPNTREHVITLTGLPGDGVMAHVSGVGLSTVPNPGYSHAASSSPGSGPLGVADVATSNYPNDESGKRRGFMMADGFQWKMYGFIPTVTEARINRSASGGANVITAGTSVIPLDVGVTWLAGDEIAICPSGFYDPDQRTEFFEVASDTLGAASVTIVGTLGFDRWAKIQYLNDDNTVTVDASTGFTIGGGGLRATANIPTTLDHRARVLHVSRRHLVTSVQDTALANKRFGGHCMVMGNDVGAPTSVIDLRGVQFDRMGQGGLIGRYPMHWHMTSYRQSDGAILGAHAAGDALMEDCTFTRSQNRALTYHGCRGVVGTRLFAVDFYGQGFFFEDGSEELNTLEDSRGYLSRDPGIGDTAPQIAWAPRGYRIKYHDGVHSWDLAGGPSGLWITNMRNTIRNNSFGDTEGPAIWNSQAQYGATGAAYGCFGPSKLVVIDPFSTPPLEWDNNEGHAARTNGREGLLCAINEYGFVAGNGPKTTSTDTRLPGGTAVAWEQSGDFYHHNAFGGYHHTIYMPDYQRFTFSDNAGFQVGSGATLQQYGGLDLHGTTQVGTATDFCFVEKSLNDEGFGYLIRVGAVSYHGTFHFHDLTAIGYEADASSAGDPIPIIMNERRHLWMTCFFGGFDNYTDPHFAYSKTMTNWNIGAGWAMYMTPGPNLQNSAPFDTWSGGTMATNDAYMPWNAMSTAFYDHWGTIFGGGAAKTVIMDIPYLTYGITSSAFPRPGGRSTGHEITDHQFIGINTSDDSGVFLDDLGTNLGRYRYLWQRVNVTTLADESGATYDTVEGDAAAFPAGCAVIPMFQAARFTIPAMPGRLAYARYTVSKALDDTADWFIIGAPWPNAAPLSSVRMNHTNPYASGGTAVSTPGAGNTKAAMLAQTSSCYWRDTTNNVLWVKCYQPSGIYLQGSSGLLSTTDDYRMTIELTD
jgi:hypothetical protein